MRPCPQLTSIGPPALAEARDARLLSRAHLVSIKAFWFGHHSNSPASTFLSNLIEVVVSRGDDDSSGDDISSAAPARVFFDLIDQTFSHEAGREQFYSLLLHPGQQLYSVFIDETDVRKVHEQWGFSIGGFSPAFV